MSIVLVRSQRTGGIMCAALILAEVLQDLCPRCGADWRDGARSCPACGFDPIGPRPPTDGDPSRGIHLRPLGLALLTLAVVVLVVVAFSAGWRLRSPSAVVQAPEPAVAPDTREVVTVAQLGRVRFAERLGESLELEAYRTQFTANDTIAWRAEFLRPPPTNELTVVISWVSVRERMQLSETTVTLRDPELTVIARDEVPLEDLVPTAGLYEVRYFAGGTKLAEGVFEVLPPDR